MPERRGTAPRAGVAGFRGGNSQHPSADLCILSLGGESMDGVWGVSAHVGIYWAIKVSFLSVKIRRKKLCAVN